MAAILDEPGAHRRCTWDVVDRNALPIPGLFLSPFAAPFHLVGTRAGSRGHRACHGKDDWQRNVDWRGQGLAAPRASVHGLVHRRRWKLKTCVLV